MISNNGLGEKMMLSNHSSFEIRTGLKRYIGSARPDRRENKYLSIRLSRFAPVGEALGKSK
jgi:hypothetical protein